MSENYEVSIKVISQEGICDKGHKIEDEWIIKDYKTPGGICLGAFNSMHSYVDVLVFGGAFPWSSCPNVVQIACPDPVNPVVFELRRLKK